MGSSFRTRKRLPGTFWAWCVCVGLFACTIGWFWLLGRDLHLERTREPVNPTTAKATLKAPAKPR